MLLRTALGTALFLSVATTGDSLTPKFEKGWTVTYTSSSSESVVMDDVSVTLNGQELPPEALEQMGDFMPPDEESTESVEVQSVIKAVENGLPSVAEHKFIEYSRSTEKGDESEEIEDALKGSRVRVTYDGDEELTAELLDDEGEVSETLDRDVPVMPSLHQVLPDDEVSEGDSWKVNETDLSESNSAFSPFKVTSEDDDDDDSPADSGREALDKAFEDTDAEFTWTKTLDTDDGKVAVITTEFEIELDLAEIMSDQMDMDDLPPDSEVTFNATLKIGMTIHWSIEHGRTVEAALNMEMDMDVDMSMPIQEGMNMEMEMDADVSMAFESTWTYGG